MITKFFIFYYAFRLLSFLSLNPILAIIIALIILYWLDRKFVGLSPSFIKPLRRIRTISKLKQQILQSPYDISAKRELARLLIERKKYTKATSILDQILPMSEDSAEFWADYGLTALNLGHHELGEERILKAMAINERVRYGQPYLRLAASYKQYDPAKAIHYAEQFHIIHSSSSEAYYLLGLLYLELGQKESARNAFQESLTVYRQLPKYRKRQERVWAFRSNLKKMAL